MSFRLFGRDKESDRAQHRLDYTSMCVRCGSARRSIWCVSEFCLDCCRENSHDCGPTKLDFGAIQRLLPPIEPEASVTYQPPPPPQNVYYDNRRYEQNVYNDNRQTHIHNHYYPAAENRQPQRRMPEREPEQWYEPEAEERRRSRPQPRVIAKFQPPRRREYPEERYEEGEYERPVPPVRRREASQAMQSRRSDSDEEVFVTQLLQLTGADYSVDEVMDNPRLFRKLTLEAARRR